MNNAIKSSAFVLAGLLAGLGLAQVGAAQAAAAANLPALEARIAALERALVITSDSVTLAGPRASVTLRDSTIALDATRDIFVRSGRGIDAFARDRVAIDAGKSASLRMEKNGSVLLRGGPIDLVSSGDIQVKATRELLLKGHKIGDN